MKREYVALAVILSILTFSIINMHYVGRKTVQFASEIRTAQTLYDGGAAKQAVSTVADSLNGWLAWYKYAHIMLRHSEVDNVTDSYYDLLSEMEESESKVPAASFGKLEQQLKNISDMEQMTIGAIF